jgi:hypothetical protein
MTDFNDIGVDTMEFETISFEMFNFMSLLTTTYSYMRTSELDAMLT